MKPNPKTLIERVNAHLAPTRKVIVKARRKEPGKGEYVLLNIDAGDRRYLNIGQVERIEWDLRLKATRW